jgi:hypothetical protein
MSLLVDEFMAWWVYGLMSWWLDELMTWCIYDLMSLFVDEFKTSQISWIDKQLQLVKSFNPNLN